MNIFFKCYNHHFCNLYTCGCIMGLFIICFLCHLSRSLHSRLHENLTSPHHVSHVVNNPNLNILGVVSNNNVLCFYCNNVIWLCGSSSRNLSLCLLQIGMSHCNQYLSYSIYHGVFFRSHGSLSVVPEPCYETPRLSISLNREC